MKRKLLHALLLLPVVLLLSSGFQASAQKVRQSYVIGFYNLENLFDTVHDEGKNDYQFLPEGSNNWTEAKYQKKLSNMARVIKAMEKENRRYHAILGISEIENRRVIDDLVSDPQILDANFQIVHYDGPDRRGVDCALLYRPDVFEYIESVSIPYTFEGTSVAITLSPEEQENFRTRDVLMVRGNIAGEMFAFYVTHLPSRIGGKGADLRSRGAEIIYQHAKALEEQYPGIKIVVMGDMNDDPFNESMAEYLHGKKDIEGLGKDDFYNPYWSMLDAGYGTLAYRGVWSIFDQELVNYNLVEAPEGTLRLLPIVKQGKKQFYGRVFQKPFMTTQEGQYKGTPFRTFSGGAFIGGYSDHYPTYIIVGK
ncbi:MAG: endonuclease/exonuclease/phosphatase family protein [Bacteroidales bacterium]|nr:endonuclease/exonuclease/phosphatase family protein [Bacteroidales bacterium]